MADTVYIVYQHPLFAKGLESLLRREGLRVVGMTRDLERAVGEIQSVRPEVVILERTMGEEMLRSVGRILSSCQGVTVIALNLAEDWMQMVQSRLVSVRKVEDLVRAIRDPSGIVAGVQGEIHIT
ncbi:MAG: hypothetical protein QN198_01820 [Armatimonadota bacterium]|nr:hypothetical protein [Armatimonadota bacterium]MDR5702324.1 hypothetical protein [Armatimonadota bacterium]MDR7435931.1 hypothetical protein [Armatimonadota bacterium]